MRAEITAINAGANQITATPRQMSGQGGTFSSTPTVSLEEGISYRLSNGAIVRGTTTNFSNLTNPTFTESTVGNNFATLAFTYYDAGNTAINPTTLALRSTIRRVDLTVAGQTSDELSTGSRQSYPVTLSVYPRNAGLR